MPELPEVETIRRQLEKLIVGKTISSIEVLNPGSFRADANGLIGKTVTAVGRKGKVLIIKQQATSNRQQDFYIHLKMSGQLLFLNHKSYIINHKHVRVIIHFADNSHLQFIDQRKFGWITDDPAALPSGTDALDPSLLSNKLEKIIASSSRPIKQIILDQSKIAGIGNIYASEILWEVKINPASKGRALPRQGSALIYSMRKILTEAIDSGGSTMADGLYQHVGGESGNYWSRRRVYDREEEPCLRCKTPIKKVVIGQRSTYWCPNCQVE